MVQNGISLLSMTASDAEDPQTLRMVAGAIANLCGNGTPLPSLFDHAHEELNDYSDYVFFSVIANSIETVAYKICNYFCISCKSSL